MAHFSDEEVVTLNALENKNLSNVKYHYWVNKTKSNNTYESLDYIEFFFSDGSLIFLSGKVKEGISIEKPNIEQEKSLIRSKFGNKIELITQDVSNENLWKPTITIPLEYVALRKGAEHYYLNDALLLNFGDYEIIIYHDQEGLLVEQMVDEEDDDEEYDHY